MISKQWQTHSPQTDMALAGLRITASFSPASGSHSRWGPGNGFVTAGATGRDNEGSKAENSLSCTQHSLTTASKGFPFDFLSQT